MAHNVNVIGAMRLLPGLLAVSLLTLVAAGCSHGTISEFPAAPAPTVTSLTLTPVGGGRMIEGATAPITSSGGVPPTGAALGAFLQYSNGSGQYVPAAWTSSDPNVIAVENDRLVARNRGTATLTVTAEGWSDSETFIVQPGIAGTWTGTYTVQECAAGSGSMYELICNPPNQGRAPGVLAVGATPPLTMVITKSGTELTATAQFGELRGTLTGTDRGSNFLTFSGEVTVNATTVTFVYWDGRVIDDVMEGLIGFEVRIAGLPSHAQVVARLDKVTRR